MDKTEWIPPLCDEYGNTLTPAYDDDGRLVRITDSAVRFSDSNSWIWLMLRISVWVLMMCLVSMV